MLMANVILPALSIYVDDRPVGTISGGPTHILTSLSSLVIGTYFVLDVIRANL